MEREKVDRGDGKNSGSVSCGETSPGLDWGLIGGLAAGCGVAALLLPGRPALVAAIVAVALGFAGGRRRQRLSRVGVAAGCMVLLYFNLVTLGILPLPRLAAADRARLGKALQGSVEVFAELRDGDRENGRRELLRRLRYTLDEARQVDLARVGRVYRDLADHFRDEFVAGLEKMISGYENGSRADMLQGARLLDQWARWQRDHQRRIEQVWRPSLPPLPVYLLRLRQ